MSKLLAFDPSQRPTAEEALAHPWLTTYHDIEDEPVCPRKFDRWGMIEELETLEQFRDALVSEVYACRREVRNLAVTTEVEQSIPLIDEDIDSSEAADSPSMLKDTIGRMLSPDSQDTFTRPNMSRKASMEPGTQHPSIPEYGVPFPGTNDPVVAYSRRSIFGHASRTSSTYSLKQVVNPPTGAGAEPLGEPANDKSTVAFPSTGDYVVPARHRTASMYTMGNEPEAANAADVRRLLRTLSTLSVYESGDGHAGGLADVKPIGKYIYQNHRTGDEPLHSEMPKEIAPTEGSDSADSHKEAHEKERRFTL
jgi:hypothetical protein